MKIILISLPFIVFFLLLWVLSRERVFLYVFMHKEYKRWKYLIKHAHEFTYQYTMPSGISRGTEIYTYKNYKAIVWPTGLISIYDEAARDNILVSQFDSFSKEFLNIIKNNL